VGVEARLLPGHQRNRCSIPGWDKRIISGPGSSDRLLNPRVLGTEYSLSRGKAGSLGAQHSYPPSSRNKSYTATPHI